MTMVSLFGQVKEEIISKKLIIEKKITEEDGSVRMETIELEGEAIDEYLAEENAFHSDDHKIIMKKFHSMDDSVFEDMEELEDIDIEFDSEKNTMIIRRNGKEEIIELEGYDNKPTKFKEHWTMEEMDDRGYLGVMIDQTEEGVKIVEVNEASAAAEAGLKAGDIIREVNGEEVTKVEQTIDILSKFKPGEGVKLKYDRNGKSSSVLATLGEYRPMMKEEQEFKWIEKHDDDGEKKKIKRKIIIIEEEDD
jgi:PDZ domain-containing secreted protein